MLNTLDDKYDDPNEYLRSLIGGDNTIHISFGLLNKVLHYRDLNPPKFFFEFTSGDFENVVEVCCN